MDISIGFMHPTDGKVICVTLESSLTGQEIIGELITNDFVPSSIEGYNLAKKGGHQLDNSKSLLQNMIKDNDIIRIIPATSAC